MASWAPFGGPGGFNDYDSIELGDGPAEEGLTAAGEQSMMSLWAMAASPLVINADLTHLDPLDLSYLIARAVIAVDQDSVDATRIVNDGNEQVFAKTGNNGAVILGLFSYSVTLGPGAVQLLRITPSRALPESPLRKTAGGHGIAASH